MPDNYKEELQNYTTSSKAITKPLQSNNIQENNILLVTHFDENFPITEEQLQTMKCVNGKNKKTCKKN